MRSGYTNSYGCFDKEGMENGLESVPLLASLSLKTILHQLRKDNNAIN
jgi:hypothetical protein